jgi:integrase
LLTIAWETGARPQEILKVEARHVNLAEARWEFPPKEAKGKKRHRIVYLNDAALAITQRLMTRWPEGPLFRNTDGHPWIPDAVNCRFCRLQAAMGRRRLQALGLALSSHPNPKQRRKENRALACQYGTKYCLYNFRHTFCDNALKRGVDPVTVSVLMGHVDTSMVARRYQHVGQDPEHMRRSLRKATT